MKFSYNWLKELSQTNKSPLELKEILTLHSFEVEGIEDLSQGLEKVIIGEVLEVKKHPDADKLNVARVNVGKEELQIVCGASNLEEGQKVPVALAGAVLPGSFEIKKTTIRGIESCGMICAEDELGLGTEHAGIMVLAQDAPIGESFAQFFGLNDYVLEIDILPNRAHDALSYEGMAREIASLEGRIILEGNYDLKSEFGEKEELKIKLETPKCPRYIGAVIKNVKIGVSPLWIKNRLKLSGINPINNVVDITNYVMLETGQPLHAFDAQKVSEIGVRLAEGGEEITILNGEKVILRKEDIVITDGQKPIALAGVMGGLESGINDDTSKIVLESANFDAVTIRRTKSVHKIESDAAYRYERDLDPNLTQKAIIKAIKMLKEVVQGELEAISDNYPKKIESWEINLEVEKVYSLLGIQISKKEIITILNNLGIRVNDSGDRLICQIPTWRIDLKNQEDLIEEIGRIYGYTEIETKPLRSHIQVPEKNKERDLERKIKNILVHSGMDEIKGYSFYSREDARALGLDDEKHVTLMNPMNPDQELIRQTLVSGLLRAGKKSLSYFDKLSIFDVGKVYVPSKDFLPRESLVLGGAILARGDKGEQFFELKGILENIFYKLGIEKIDLVADFDEDKFGFIDLHKSRKALINSYDGLNFGFIGEVTKSAHKHFGLKRVRACVFELNLANIIRGINHEKRYISLDRFPSVNRDISIIVKDKITAKDIKTQIKNLGGEFLREINLFDNFINPENKDRSMAFHLTFISPERTLTAQEVDEKMDEIMTGLEKNLNISIKRN